MVKKKIKTKKVATKATNEEIKLYVTYGLEEREGFFRCSPLSLWDMKSGTVAEIQGQEILEKMSNLAGFIKECHRILKPGGKCIFTAPYFAHVAAWRSPLTVRGISEQSLNFADKTWREQNKCTELDVGGTDFEVQGSFALEQTVMNRAEETRTFWTKHYMNIAQFIMFTLIKREPK